MMGPIKRSHQRNTKCKEREKGNNTFAENFEIIDLTSTQEQNNKLGPRSSKLCKNKKTDVDGIRSRREQCLQIERSTSASQDKNPLYKDQLLRKEKNRQNEEIDSPVESTRESDVNFKIEVEVEGKKDNIEDKNMDDSLCDDDILDSQFSSQDNLLLDSSQDGEQCEVRWDYTSPETMKQLKKMRGKYCVQDVKRILVNFPDLPVKPIPSALHQLRFSIPPQKSAEVAVEKNRVLKAKQKAAKRWQRCERRRGAVEDMILFLQQHQEKQDKVSADARTLEVSSERDPVVEEKSNENLHKAEDSWSDDDLFRDNSFLIEATQNLEKLLPVITKASEKQTGFDSIPSKQSSSKSCDTFSSAIPGSLTAHSFNSTSVIPSSYVRLSEPKQTAPSAKTSSCNENHSSHKFISKSDTTTSSCISCVNKPVYKGPMLKGQIVSGSVTHQQNINHQTDSSQKTFRRHHTFQNKPFIKTASPCLNSPFRRCLSFDNNVDSNFKSDKVSKKESTNETLSHQNISFDSSLNDEFLLQATENVDSLCKSTLGNQTNSASNFCDKKTSANYNLHSATFSKSYCFNNLPELHKDINIGNTILSPVRPLMQDFSLKRLQSKPSHSPVQSFFKKTFAIDNQQAIKHKSQTGPPSTSTPVKMAKILDQTNNVSEKPQTNKGSDSFLDDDSFMNDDAMFESQILPILVLAENQVTENKSNESRNTTKYSPDEIENKRLAALQKLRKNDSSHLPPENTAQKITSPEVIEQTQTTSSPRQCSQEEINRKKQAAQRKLLAKTNSTGSIRISPPVGISSKEQNNNNTTSGNDIKCSQEEIKLKREEALKKRRLKMMQLPNRKS